MPPPPASPSPAADEAAVLRFARAFRAAARSVSFYPPAHPAVVSSLESLVAATKPLTASGAVCLTILPNTFLVAGTPLESTDAVMAEIAAILHKHGVGAISLTSGIAIDSWCALLTLLGRSIDDVRAAGGIQRAWKETRHQCPAILEIDFGDLLRGRIGGDLAELAGLLNHYLETGAAEAAIEDVGESIAHILKTVDDAQEAAEAILKQLRIAVLLARATQAEHTDGMFRNAAALAGKFPEDVMAALLARRGSADAMVAETDVVTLFVGQLSDRHVAEFLVTAVASSPHSAQLSKLFTELTPAVERRHRILHGVGGLISGPTTFERDFLERWEQLERDLEAYSDPRFVSAEYGRELRSARAKRSAAVRTAEEPPERLAGWLGSIDEHALDDLDMTMLLDLARVERDIDRWPAVLELLEAQVVDAADRGDWSVAAVVAEAIAQEASEEVGSPRRRLARETLDGLAELPTCSQALAGAVAGTPSDGDGMARLLRAVGPALVPALTRRHADAPQEATRARIEDLVAAYGRASVEPLRQMLKADAPAVQCAAIRLLQRSSAVEHLPALEALLTGANAMVRREALVALATSSSDRGRDILARGVARADEAHQRLLLEDLLGLGQEQGVPVLRRLLAQLDQRTVSRAAYLSVIAALGHAGTEEAAAALGLVFERTSWRAPLRARAFRSAASSALKNMRRQGT